MILWLILIGLCLYIVRSAYLSEGKIVWSDAFWALLGSTVASLVFMIFFSLLQPTKQVPDVTLRLETMNLGNPQLQGGFFLGTGRIDTNEYYVFRYYTTDNALKDDRVLRYEESVADVYLIRDQPAGQAYLVIYKNVFATDWQWMIALIPSNLDGIKYEFHIPVDAIVPEINIQ